MSSLVLYKSTEAVFETESFSLSNKHLVLCCGCCLLFWWLWHLWTYEPSHTASGIPEGPDDEQLEPTSRKPKNARRPNVSECGDAGGAPLQHHCLGSWFLPQPVSHLKAFYGTVWGICILTFKCVEWIAACEITTFLYILFLVCVYDVVLFKVNQLQLQPKASEPQCP